MVDADLVSDIIREVVTSEVMSRHNKLTDDDIAEKSKNDFVTRADVSTEEILRTRLCPLVPSSIVIGEESLHMSPENLNRTLHGAPTWIIDPIDGTRSFVDGGDNFCTMVALAIENEIVQSWIYIPIRNEMVVAEQGSGAFLNGHKLTTRQSDQAARGFVFARYMNSQQAQAVGEMTKSFAPASITGSAGLEYVDMARGEIDLILYWRALIWDHGPGSLIVNESGGRCAFLDGQSCAPSRHHQFGILSTCSHVLWDKWGPKLARKLHALN